MNKQTGSWIVQKPQKPRSERLRLNGLVCRHCGYTSSNMLQVGVKWKVWTPIIYSEKWLKEDIYIRHRPWQPPPQSQLPPCPLEQKMCFPNENKLRPGQFEAVKFRNMRSNKDSCGGWKEKWNRFWGEMYRVIKSLLYIFLNGTCSCGVVKLWRGRSKTVCKWQFLLPEDLPTDILLKSCALQFGRNGKLF